MLEQNNNYKRPESVLVVVHTATHIMLIKRTDHNNFWQSVTGSLEWGENPESAALRELQEETNIQVNTLRATGITRSYAILEQWIERYPPGSQRNREHLFYCFLEHQPEVVLDPSEHSDVQWLDFQQAQTKVFSWSNRLAIQSLSQRAVR